MKKLVRTFFLFVSFSFLISHAVQAASGILLNSDQATVQNGGEKRAQLVYSPKLSRAEVETFMGRKMTFAIALGQIKETGQRGYGFAIAGLVIGIAVTALALISLL